MNDSVSLKRVLLPYGFLVLVIALHIIAIEILAHYELFHIALYVFLSPPFIALITFEFNLRLPKNLNRHYTIARILYFFSPFAVLYLSETIQMIIAMYLLLMILSSVVVIVLIVIFKFLPEILDM